jgi:hypothetical protein
MPKSEHANDDEDADEGGSPRLQIVLVLVLIVDPKLFIKPGTKAFFQLSSVSGPGL